MEDNNKGGADDEGENERPWTPHHWDHFRKTEREVKKLAPQARSRYLAELFKAEKQSATTAINHYEAAPSRVKEGQASAAKRIVELKREADRAQQKGKPTEQEILDKEKHDKLIGQLKAAEARNHIRVMRLQYEMNRSHEIKELIASQPTAVKAVRLQALLQTRRPRLASTDLLNKTERHLVECLIDDVDGLRTNRT